MTHTVGPVLALGAVFVVIITASFAAYYYSNMQSDMKHRAKTTTEFLQITSDRATMRITSPASPMPGPSKKNTIELQFISTSGRIVASSYGRWVGLAYDPRHCLRHGDPPIGHLCGQGSGHRRADYGGLQSHDLFQRRGHRCAAVCDQHESGQQTALFVILVALAAGALLVLVVIFSSNYIRSILEPVAEITATAKRIAGGSYGVQIRSKYDDEIGDLAATINEMSNQINQNEKMQAEFISSLSHELRTPLTAISGWSETALSGRAWIRRRPAGASPSSSGRAAG